MNKQLNKTNPPTNNGSKWIAERAKTDFSTGKVLSKTSYVNRINHGLKALWYDNGQKHWQRMLRKNKKHGQETVWWDNGQKAVQQMLVDNKVHGLGSVWYENGIKSMDIHYTRGIEYARIEWDEKGNITQANLPTYYSNSKKNPLLKSSKAKA